MKATNGVDDATTLLTIWTPTGATPARAVMSRSRLCNRFKFPSLAQRRTIYLEGVLEFAAAYWLEALTA